MTDAAGDPTAEPRRIRRRRVRGWTIAGATSNPKGAVAVDRTSRWGNPHAVRRTDTGWRVVDIRTGAVGGTWPTKTEAMVAAIGLFRTYLDESPELVRLAREQLAGRDLACYCAEDEPCHADVWIETVNPR